MGFGGPTPRGSDSVGLGWGLGFCISKEFLGAADAVAPWAKLGESQG